jgi:hypothetical protein
VDKKFKLQTARRKRGWKVAAIEHQQFWPKCVKTGSGASLQKNWFNPAIPQNGPQMRENRFRAKPAKEELV